MFRMKGNQYAIPNALSCIIRKWYIWLFFITALAIFVRILPSWINAAWGCDFGIYYGLTNTFVETKEVINAYAGWGGAYQYFPILYIITGFAHWITGVDVLIIMPKIAPVFGGLSVFIFYFVVNELLGDRKKALLSSLFLAVLPFHAYQTSQAAPLTIGHFFLMLSLFLFLRTRKNTRYIIPLIISSVLLIMTHHLTTYIFLISLLVIIFIENIRQQSWTRTITLDIIYVVSMSCLVFYYWRFVALPVHDVFMSNGLYLGSFELSASIVIVLFYLLLAAMMGSIVIIRKLGIRPLQSSNQPSSSPLVLFAIVGLALLAFWFLSQIDVPWGRISFTPTSIIYSIPFLFVFSLGILGFRHTINQKNGSFICGWFLAICFSLLYGFFSFNNVLYPHRHLEYIMAPLSVMAVFGFNSLITFDYHLFSPWKKNLLKKYTFVYPVLIAILVTSNAASVYPAYLAWEELDTSYETITTADIDMIDWVAHNLDKNTTVIAADHRLALLVTAEGYNTTRDTTVLLWNSTLPEEFIFELEECNNHSRVTHVIIDDIMKENVVHIGFDGVKSYMTNESYEKFLRPPFYLLYRNETLDETLDVVHWVEIYSINWEEVISIADI